MPKTHNPTYSLDGFTFVKVMAHRIGVDNRMGRYPDLAINRNEGKTNEAKQKNNESVLFHAGYLLKSKLIQNLWKRLMKRRKCLRKACL